jgi:hypothetical protein
MRVFLLVLSNDFLKQLLVNKFKRNTFNMKNLLQRFSILQSFPGLNSWSWGGQYVLLFDSESAAQEIAFMLNGEWDGCNGVVLDKCDLVAVNTAASLVKAKWCYGGTSVALLVRFPVDELKRRYSSGERNFINANLRCAMLNNLDLSKANLSWAKLNWANLSRTNLCGVDLTAADLTNANLSGANLKGANLSLADLRGADLNQANLSDTNLKGAKLNEADLMLSTHT